MKIRQGWVSNSSSTNFILACNEIDKTLAEFFDENYEHIMGLTESGSIASDYMRLIKGDLISNCFLDGLDRYPQSYTSEKEYRDEYFQNCPYDKELYLKWGEHTTKEEHYAQLERELEQDNTFNIIKEALKKFKIAHYFELRNSGNGPNAYEEELCYSLRNCDSDKFMIRVEE